MLSRKFLATLAGSIYAVSLVLFTDGFLTARTTGTSYNFISFLPLVIGNCGLVVVLTLDPGAVLARGHNDDEDVVRNKGLFFLAALLFFTSLMVGMWGAISSPAVDGALWGQVTPLLSSFAIIGCAVTLFKLKQNGEDDDF